MNEITAAIATRHAQIKTLQADIDALQRAASVLGAPAKSAATPKAQPKRKTKPRSQPRTKAQGKRHQWSAAEKAAIGKRMKAYWAKRRKTRR